jgi:eukaryotic-like serine/threonine-protein kinase
MSLVGAHIGHIRVLEVLGQGGMGEVYVGFDETLQRRVALKAIRSDKRLQPAAKARFLREARILSQLEHPNICRIYGYVEHEGSELLVLELVDGETLGSSLEKGLERRRKLEVGIDVAGVLAAAHAAGIVHRDLKPDNVMIARDGVVKVLDFGIARPYAADPAALEGSEDAGAIAAEATDAHPTLTADAALTATPDVALRTAVGSLVGTPLYMSPEQARGEPVTTASDMYAFGLLLRALFGESAVARFDMDSLRRRRAGERLPLAGIPKDVANLIARLEAPSPAARATAVETVRQLEWIRDKPKRRLRRLAVAAVLGAAALFGLKYTLDLRRERGIAVGARRIAEQRRQQAEELISFMLGDVRGKLEPLGKLELLDDVGQKALDYFASVPESELSDEELARRAKALYQIGDVRIKQGNLIAAMKAFEQAVALSEGLVARHPQNTEWLETLSQSHFWIGNGHWNQGRLEPALAEFEAYRGLAERLAETDPSNLDWRMEVAYGEFNVASVLEAQGRLDLALGHLEACVNVVEGLVAAAPRRDDWRLELAKSQLQIGRIKEALGRLDEALVHHRANLEIMQGLVDKDRGHAGWLEQLAMAHGDIGSVLEHRGAWGEARAHRVRYLEITEELAARDPTNHWWRGIIAVGQSNLGRLACQQGNVPRGLSLMQAATRTLAQLGAGDPQRVQWQSELGQARVRLGHGLAAAGDLAGALAEAEAAAEILGRLAEQLPQDIQPRRALGECELLRGEVLARMDRADEARAAWSRAREVVQPVAQESHDGTLLAPLTRALLLLERTAEARPFLARLESQGYQDPRLTALAARQTP